MIKILDDSETLMTVIKQKLSVSRFGDGELVNFILTKQGIKNPIFEQKYDEQLSKDLIDLLSGKTKSKNNMICVYPCLTQKDFEKAKKYKKNMETMTKMNFLFNKFFKEVGINYDLIGDAFCFRKVRCEEDQLRNHRMILKEHFKTKKVLLVSSLTKKEIKELDLFENLHFIKIDNNNAYQRIREIENEILLNVKKNNIDLVLCSIGPTATVLANNLSIKNIQTWDIGQIKRI